MRSTGSYLGGGGMYPSGSGSTPAPPFAFDNALGFDGVNDYVSLMGANAIKSAQPFSMSFWFNTDDITATRLAGFSTNAGRGFFIGLLDLANYSDLYFICDDGSSNRITHTFSNNTWHHIVITYNGSGFTTRSNYNCYVDGISKTVKSANPFSAAATEVTIGSQGTLFGGSHIQDEWYYWDNYELSATDVTNLYNGGFGDYASVVASTPTFELRFNESGSDTTAADSSGNGNNGTLNNFPASGMWIPNRTGQTPTIMYPSWDVLESNISVSNNGTSTNRVTRNAGSAYEGAVDSLMGLDDFILDYTVQASGENYKYIGVTTDNTQAKSTPQANDSFFIVNTTDVRIRVNNAEKATLTIITGDVLTIKRVGGTTQFFKNGTLLYTKLVNNGGLAAYPMALPGDPGIYVEGIKITGYLYGS